MGTKSHNAHRAASRIDIAAVSQAIRTAPEVTLIARALVDLAREHGLRNGFTCADVAERCGLSQLAVGRFGSRMIVDLQLEVGRMYPDMFLSGYNARGGHDRRIFRTCPMRDGQ